jgi:methyl coenzyme M reductase beta subunit
MKEEYLEDEESNRVFVNSQAEADYYTAPRTGGPFNGSYWKDVGSAGVITQEIIDTQVQASGKTMVLKNIKINKILVIH